MGFSVHVTPRESRNRSKKNKCVQHFTTMTDNILFCGKNHESLTLREPEQILPSIFLELTNENGIGNINKKLKS